MGGTDGPKQLMPKGIMLPNTWYATEDMVTPKVAKNYDYQDAVYLLVNAKPESAALDPSVPGPLPGEPSLVFDFNQTYAGSLNDKMGDYWLYQYPTQQERYLHEQNVLLPKLLDINTGGAGTLAYYNYR